VAVTTQRPTTARRAARLGVAGAWLGLVVLLVGCTPQPMTEQARQTHWLYNFFIACAAGVFVIVGGLILWSVLRYRDDGRPAPQFHGNPKVETLWTVLPILLVGVLIVFTIQIQDRVGRQAPDPAVTIDVTGFQWQWQFTYEGHGIQVLGAPGRQPELVVPAGRPVHIKLTSVDVQHSFYVPAFLFKRDAIPGFINRFDLTITKPGSYQGACAFICGLNHDQMGFRVRALPPADFQRWLASNQRG
jgi:cytochrome c oxidase subunit II